MIEKHLNINETNDILVKKYQKQNKLQTYSMAVNNLLEIGLSNNTFNIKYNELINKVNLNYSKTFVILKLLEQLYSDISPDELSNPNNCEALKKFKKGLNKNYDN